MDRSHLMIELTKEQAEDLLYDVKEFMENCNATGNLIRMRELWATSCSKDEKHKQEMLKEGFMLWLQYSILTALTKGKV